MDQGLLLEEVCKTHCIAERIHEKIEYTSLMAESRCPGVGGNNILFVASKRCDRAVDISTDRRKSIHQLECFAIKVVPFLPAPSGTPGPLKTFCTESICCLLGVSRKFLYGCKRNASTASSDSDLTSIVDSPGDRMRQHRRVGWRLGYPELDELQISSVVVRLFACHEYPYAAYIMHTMNFKDLLRR